MQDLPDQSLFCKQLPHLSLCQMIEPTTCKPLYFRSAGSIGVIREDDDVAVTVNLRDKVAGVTDILENPAAHYIVIFPRQHRVPLSIKITIDHILRALNYVAWLICA